MNAAPQETLVVACGALAKEILFLIDTNEFNGFRLHCVPAKFHLFPDRIVEEVTRVVNEHRIGNQPVLIGFADCGTSGQLDGYIEQHGFSRLPGAHCYEFFAGPDQFDALQQREIGTFYLTDFLARHFKNLIFQGFKLDRHPELIPLMFGHYKKIVYLAQTEDRALEGFAKEAAELINLDYERVFTGYGLLEDSLESHLNTQQTQ